MSVIDHDLKYKEDISRKNDSVQNNDFIFCLDDIPKIFLEYWASLVGSQELHELKRTAQVYGLSEDYEFIWELGILIQIMTREKSYRLKKDEIQQKQQYSLRYEHFLSKDEIHEYIYKRVTLLRSLLRAEETSALALEDARRHGRPFDYILNRWNFNNHARTWVYKDGYARYPYDTAAMEKFINNFSSYSKLKISDGTLNGLVNLTEGTKLFEKFCHILSNSKLEVLELNSTDLMENESEFRLFINVLGNPRIKTLNIKSINLGNLKENDLIAFCVAIAKNNSLRNLTMLNCFMNKLKENAMDYCIAMDYFINVFLARLPVRFLNLANNQLGENLTPNQFKNLLIVLSKKPLYYLNLSNNKLEKLIKSNFRDFCTFIENIKVTHLEIGENNFDWREGSEEEFNLFCAALRRNNHIKYVTIDLPNAQIEVIEDILSNRVSATSLSPIVPSQQSSLQLEMRDQEVKNKSESQQTVQNENTVLIQYRQQTTKTTSPVGLEPKIKYEKLEEHPYFFPNLTDQMVDDYIDEVDKTRGGPFFMKTTFLENKRAQETNCISYKNAPYFIRREMQSPHLSSCMVIGFFAYKVLIDDNIDDSRSLPCFYAEQTLFKVENGLYCIYDYDKKNKILEKTDIEYSTLSELIREEFLGCPSFGARRLEEITYFSETNSCRWLVVPLMELEQVNISVADLLRLFRDNIKRLPSRYSGRFLSSFTDDIPNSSETPRVEITTNTDVSNIETTKVAESSSNLDKFFRIAHLIARTATTETERSELIHKMLINDDIPNRSKSRMADTTTNKGVSKIDTTKTAENPMDLDQNKLSELLDKEDTKVIPKLIFTEKKSKKI